MPGFAGFTEATTQAAMQCLGRLLAQL
jgi:hypothetical protein